MHGKSSGRLNRIQKLALFPSLVGMGSMVPVSILQLNFVKRLPDLPVVGFDSNKVNLSPDAFPAAIPDGPLAFLSYTANLPLLWLASRDDRALAILKVKASTEALVAARYLYFMPAKEKAWCVYCLIAVCASFVTFGFIVLWPLFGSRESIASSRTEYRRDD